MLSVRWGSVHAPEKGLIRQAIHNMKASQVYAIALKATCAKLKSWSTLIPLVMRVSFFRGGPNAVTDDAREETGVVSCDLNIGSGITGILTKGYVVRRQVEDVEYLSAVQRSQDMDVCQ